MRLHRLRLSSFRGVAERTVDFPDSGVVVLQGPNEVGKSSMVEALDLLLTEKDSSTKAQVRSVKPVGADRGSEVEAELSTGPYRFTYRKRWHVRPRTELTVHAPVPCQLSGVPAHERVRAMLGETLDEGLWKALRLLQGVPLQQEALSGSTALQSALDAAAGAGAGAGAGVGEGVGAPAGLRDGGPGEAGDQGSFVEAVEDEYARYWTPTGRVTGAYGELGRALAEAERRAEAARRELDEVGRDVERHAELATELDALTDLRSNRHAERTALELAWTRAEQLDADLRRRRQDAAAARHAHTAALTALRRRTDAVAQLAQRSAAVQRSAVDVDAGQAHLAELGAQVEAAEVPVTAARTAADRLRGAAERARADATGRQEAVDAARLVARLGRVEAAAADVERLEAVVATGRVTDRHVSRIERATQAHAEARARQGHAAPTVLLESVDGSAVRVRVGVAPAAGAGTGAAAAPGGAVDHSPDAPPAGTVTVRPDRPHRAAVTAPTALHLPGGLRVTVSPGADGDELAARVEETRAALRSALEEAGVADLTAAREACRRARDADRDLAAARRRLADHLGRDDLATLRREVAGAASAGDPVPADVPDPQGLDDALATARTAATSAEARYREATRTLEAATAVHDRLRDDLAERTLALVALQSTRAAEQAEVERLAAALAQDRAVAPDEELARSQEAARRAAGSAAEDEAAAWAQLDAADRDDLRRRVEAARGAADRLAREWDDCRLALAQVGGRLESAGAQGRQDAYDDAVTRLEATRREHAAVHRRAAAAAALREVLLRHRDASRRRYVAPFTERVTALGEVVFGPGFAVHVDDDLRIASRTLDGTTVAWELLSTGAKEQLAVITRLACAALVDEADGVPVVLDDALGYCDPERLARVADVVAGAGRSCQVIVLTCTPQRYASITSATVVALGA